MDPNQTLSDIRRICEAWLEADIIDISTNFDALVDLISDLDGWLSIGGFRPNDWS